jgi:hypothetical protein
MVADKPSEQASDSVSTVSAAFLFSNLTATAKGLLSSRIAAGNAASPTYCFLLTR